MSGSRNQLYKLRTVLIATLAMLHSLWLELEACLVARHIFSYGCNLNVAVYSRTSIIRTPMCHFNVKGVMFLNITVNQLREQTIILHLLTCFSIHCTMI